MPLPLFKIVSGRDFVLGDLYNIPRDNGEDYRLKKFVEYQHEVPSIHYRFLGEWIKRRNITLDRAVDMCWLMSVTYNEITVLLLDNFKESFGMTPPEIWKAHKAHLDFGSARKYAKNNDWYLPLMEWWERETDGTPYLWLLSKQGRNGYDTYNNLQRTLRTAPYVGRFAADLFIECVTYLKPKLRLRIKEPPVIDWDNSANLTSGIYNIFYQDERANEFDKARRVNKSERAFLTKRLLEIQQEIQATYPEQDPQITMFIGKICSFRNLFKAARYGGFHHDRELGVLNIYKQIYPDYSDLWENCFSLRSQIFPKQFLGELHDWNGIRPLRKKLWLKFGLTGVEEESIGLERMLYK